MSTGPWRTPSGVAPIAPFRSPHELLDAVTAHVVGGIELAIAQRVVAGEISDRGDAASTYFPDAARIRTVIHGPRERAPELERAAADQARRDHGVLGQLAASSHALARGFERWQLTDDDRRIVLVLVAAALSARVSRLLAVLGGDPSAPAVVVEAVAALLAPGDAGVRRLVDRLARGPLDELALVHVGRPEIPFARRPLAPAPRLLELAFDRCALDPGCGAVLIGGGGRAVDEPVRAAVRAVLHRGVHPRVGAVAADRDAIDALAAAVAEVERPLVLAPLAAVTDPARRAVVVREAVLIDAAIAVELEPQGGVLEGAAIEQLAARVPTFLIYGHVGSAPRLTIASLTIPTRAPSRGQIAQAVAHGFGAGDHRHLQARSRLVQDRPVERRHAEVGEDALQQHAAVRLVGLPRRAGPVEGQLLRLELARRPDPR
jgi:hypothetical protein